MISRSFVAALAVTVLVPCAASVAAAQETTLMFATLGRPNGHTNVDIFHPWAKHMNEIGKGTLKIDVRDGYAIASRSNFYTRVLTDVVQIAFGPHGSGSASGIFPRTSVLELPFQAETSAQSSVAFWRVYKSGLLDAEYKDIHPLWMADVPQGSLHCTKPLKTLDNLNGLKILTPAKTQGRMIDRLGGAPTSLLLENAYGALQRHTVDCMYFPWTGVQTFKLAEVTSYHVNANLGGAGVMVFMSRKKYEGLPSAVRKLIDDNSGEAMALKHGASLDRVQDRVRDHVKADPKQQVVNLSPQQEKAWRGRLESLAQDWAKNTPDGAKVLAAYRSELAKVKAGH